MQREIIPFTTEEAWLAHRVHDLTSSDVPCLFGVGYQSYDGLLQCKLSKIQATIEPNERMDWGVALQNSIAQEFARKNQWNIRNKTEYIRIPDLRLGSSFDFSILGETYVTTGKILENIKIVPGGVYPIPMLPIGFFERDLLEIKNVDSLQFKNKWKQGFEIEATPYIEIQVQHQLLVSGLETAYIGVLIGGNEGKILKRTANKKIQDAILIKSAEFWRRIDESKSRE